MSLTPDEPSLQEHTAKGERTSSTEQRASELTDVQHRSPLSRPVEDPSRPRRRRFSSWQVAIFVILALLVGGGAGTFLALFNLGISIIPITLPLTPPATPNSSASQGTFLTFRNNNFSIKYPGGWKQTQNGDTVSFSRGDGPTEFIVSTHNQDTDPSAIIADLTETPLSCSPETDPSPSVTVDNISWQKSVQDCFLDGIGYVEDVLIHPNSQTSDQTVILYAGYQDVSNFGKPNLISFAQANTQYFQPMLQSFQAR